MARFLVQADVLPPLAEPLWDTSWLLSDTSLLGRFLHTLIGYEATPSGIQVAFYIGAFLLILFGMRKARLRPTPTSTPIAPPKPVH